MIFKAQIFKEDLCMKLRKRIVALGAAMIMAVSMMSVVASAYENRYPRYVSSAISPMAVGSVYQPRQGTNGTYNYPLGTVYCKAEVNGSLYRVYSGLQSTTYGATGYANVWFGTSLKGSSGQATYYNGLNWTDGYDTVPRTVTFGGMMSF